MTIQILIQMANINTPPDVLEKTTFKSLPAKEKEEYVSNVLKKTIALNPTGVTISQIKEATGLTYSTIWHHLEVLSCTAQCSKVSKGNTDIYYPPGSMSHLNELGKGKSKYAISLVQNSEGRFVCIQEKKENRMGNYSICKGVHIPVEIIDDLVKELGKVKRH